MFSEKFAELECIEQSDEKPLGYLIFLHGLGKNGKWQKDQFLNLLGEQQAAFPQIKIIFPTGVIRKDENKGLVPSWFDVSVDRTKEPEYTFNYDHIQDSMTYVDYLIENIIRSGVPADRIFIGGVSQGAIISLAYTFCKDMKLRGVLSLSGMFLKEYEKYVRNDVSYPPLFQAHYTEDSIIPYGVAIVGYKFLISKGVNLETLTISEEGHEINEQMLKAAYDWIKKSFTLSTM